MCLLYPVAADIQRQYGWLHSSPSGLESFISVWSAGYLKMVTNDYLRKHTLMMTDIV